MSEAAGVAGVPRHRPFEPRGYAPRNWVDDQDRYRINLKFLRNMLDDCGPYEFITTQDPDNHYHYPSAFSMVIPDRAPRVCCSWALVPVKEVSTRVGMVTITRKCRRQALDYTRPTTPLCAQHHYSLHGLVAFHVKNGLLVKERGFRRLRGVEGVEEVPPHHFARPWRPHGR